MDGSQSWPFPDDTFEAVLYEHMAEHVPQALGVYMMRETFRTMKPSAYFRVVTPDLNWFASRILAPASEIDLA